MTSAAQYYNQMMEEIQILRKFDILSDWSDYKLKQMFYHFQILHFSKDNAVYREQSECSFIYFIAEGEFVEYRQVHIVKPSVESVDSKKRVIKTYKNVPLIIMSRG